MTANDYLLKRQANFDGLQKGYSKNKMAIELAAESIALGIKKKTTPFLAQKIWIKY